MKAHLWRTLPFVLTGTALAALAGGFLGVYNLVIPRLGTGVEAALIAAATGLLFGFAAGLCRP
jgi:hypothetical protein